jgi:periplasmic mercuric ion binding protein
MKTIKLFLAVIVMAVISSASYARMPLGNSKTEIVKVQGNCGTCKAKIEKAAKMEGVSKAEWNQDTKKLTLVYDPSKVTTDAIQKKIAAAGYDTEKYKADEKAYQKLDACCQYNRR